MTQFSTFSFDIALWAGQLAALFCGFVLAELVVRQQKSLKNIVTKYGLALGLGLFCFWATGYGLGFGLSFMGLFGISGFAPGLASSFPQASAEFSLLLNQSVLASAAMMILFAPLARQMNLRGYVLLGAFFGLLIYPIVAHWFWAGLSGHAATGLLAGLGAFDMGGGIVVHLLAAFAGLSASLAIGAKPWQTDNPSCTPKGWKSAALLLASLFAFAVAGSAFVSATSTAPAAFDQTILVDIVVSFLAASFVGIAFSYLRKEDFTPLYALRLGIVGPIACLVGLSLFSPISAAVAGAVAALTSLWMSRFLFKLGIADNASVLAIHISGGLVGGILAVLLPETLTSKTFATEIMGQLQALFASSLFVFATIYVFMKLCLFTTRMRLSEMRESNSPLGKDKTSGQSSQDLPLPVIENKFSQDEDIFIDELSDDKTYEPKSENSAPARVLMDEEKIEQAEAEHEEILPELIGTAIEEDAEEEPVSTSAEQSTAAPLALSIDELEREAIASARAAVDLDTDLFEGVQDEETPSQTRIKDAAISLRELEDIRSQNEMLSRTLQRVNIDLEQRSRDVQSLNNQLNDLTSAFVVSERTKHAFFTLTQNIFDAHIKEMQALTSQSDPAMLPRLPKLIQEMSIEHARNLAAIKSYGEAMEVTIARDQIDNDLRRIIENVKGKFGETLASMNIIFHVRIDKRILALKGNPQNMRMILEQLAEQAVKSNSRGGLVHIDLRLEDSGEATIEVVDSGKGMAPEKLEMALDPLNLEDDPTRDVADRIGFGLVRRLIDIHDGDMHISSEPGVGTRVIVTWPKEKVRLAPVEKVEKAAKA